MTKYLIKAPYYREGVYYAPGMVIEVEDDVKPSRTWQKVEEAEKAPEKPESGRKGRSRPNDQDPPA